MKLVKKHITIEVDAFAGGRILKMLEDMGYVSEDSLMEQVRGKIDKRKERENSLRMSGV